MGLRDVISSKPWVGWVVAGLMFALAATMYFKLQGYGDPDSAARLSETVTIKCAETGREWEMNRGLMELELFRRLAFGALSAEEGLLNPETQRYTGYPFSKGEWSRTIERINTERAEASGSSPAARKIQASTPPEGSVRQVPGMTPEENR